MNSVIKFAIVILAVSAVAAVWGAGYRNSHVAGAVAETLGSGSVIYSLAGWALGLGILVFLVGVGFLIVGIIKGS